MTKKGQLEGALNIRVNIVTSFRFGASAALASTDTFADVVSQALLMLRPDGRLVIIVIMTQGGCT